MVPEGDIRIDADGLWFYRGTEMIRREIVDLFYRNLHQDESGRYFIEIGKQRYPVAVEDTAYVVWKIRWCIGRDKRKEYGSILLSDNTVEVLDPGTLRIGKDHIPYCRVKNRRFEARFSRPGYYQLAERLQYDPADDTYSISLNGRRYCIFHESPE
ncbi:MAG: DUF1285 domain-containing protein [Acidobacteria bacterium]|nr:DUF1285 domain-containing protein [Acidobacteriota bacterium]